MSELTRRQVIQAGLLAGAALTTQTAVAGPDQEKWLSQVDFFLPVQLKPADLPAEQDGTLSRHEWAGTTFWLKMVCFGDGVPFTVIGLYAPDQEGVFHRCLTAESLAAGNLKASIDPQSGLLELREQANSPLKGQLILACNLRSVGTAHSIKEKQDNSE